MLFAEPAISVPQWVTRLRSPDSETFNARSLFQQILNLVNADDLPLRFQSFEGSAGRRWACAEDQLRDYDAKEWQPLPSDVTSAYTSAFICCFARLRS
jgi:hypothetical protein